jgi:hypothetical protein
MLPYIPYIVNSIGLCLDICGALLLFKYGLPTINRGNVMIWAGSERENDEQSSKIAKYDRKAWTGVACLVLGFVCQLVSNLINMAIL